MNIAKFRRMLNTPTSRLAGTYLFIIMLMSIGFSIVFYKTSSHELGRQIPPHSLFGYSQTTTGPGVNGYGRPHQPHRRS